MVERFRAAHGGIERADQGGLVYYEDYERVERELAEARAAAERQWEGWIKEEALRKAAEAKCDRLAAEVERLKAEVKRLYRPAHFID